MVITEELMLKACNKSYALIKTDKKYFKLFSLRSNFEDTKTTLPNIKADDLWFIHRKI